MFKNKTVFAMTPLLAWKGLIFSLIMVSFPALADHASIGLGVGMAAPIVTESGMTLPDGKWAVGLILLCQIIPEPIEHA